MRAASTSSPSAMSTMAASAPDVTSISVGSVGHSACHGPALRSWSCTCAAKIVAARFGAMVAAASALAAATGLRLCGIVDEPPRPSPDGSKASPTSVCIISETSRAILPQVPVRIASTDAASAMRSRWVCQGASGRGRSSSRASRSATCNPLSPSAASVPAAPPNCSASVSLRNRSSRFRERCSAAAYSASLRPNGIGSACCSQVRATTGVWRCFRAKAAKPATARPVSASRASMPARRPSMAPVSMTSWLVAPQWT